MRISTPVIVVMTAALMCCGCWGSKAKEPQLVSVSGTVTLNGAPLPKASIAFHPLSEGNSSYGRTNENGEYRLQYSGQKAGAVPGSHRVEIRTKEEIVDREGKLISDQPELLPRRYHDETTLTADVAAAEEQQINFDLKSK